MKILTDVASLRLIFIFLLALLLMFLFLISFNVESGNAQTVGTEVEKAGNKGSPPLRRAVYLAGGASTSASLINIIKVRIPDLGGYSLTSVGASQEFYRGEYVSWGIEGQLSKHLEKSNLYSAAVDIVLRWLLPPWHKWMPGSFGFGNGLSYTTDYLELETSAIARTSKLLYHIILEYEFSIRRTRDNEIDWAIFFRDHHRSGIFGIFDNVTGGSDYLCLGVRHYLR